MGPPGQFLKSLVVPEKLENSVYLFPWSDWLDQKCVLKPVKRFWLIPVITIFSKWKFSLQFWPRKQCFSGHSMTPCRLLEKNSSRETAAWWLLSEWSCRSIVMTWASAAIFPNFLPHSSKDLQTLPLYPWNRHFQKPIALGSCFPKVSDCLLVHHVSVLQLPRLLIPVEVLEMLDQKHVSFISRV